MIRKVLFMLLLTVPAMANYPGCGPVGCGPVCAPDCNPCCVSQFDGFYIGGNVGWGHNDFQWDDLSGFSDFIDPGLPNTIRVEKDDVIAGVQIGYNWQCCSSVFGIEADWNWANHSRTTTTFTDEDRVFSTELRHRARWFGTVRGRAGIVVDCLLLYGTAGFAYLRSDHRFTGLDTSDPEESIIEEINHDRTRYGGVGGFGAEWSINDAWSLKAEFLYLVFHQDTSSFTSAVVAPDVVFDFQTHESMTIARLGVNYRWGCGCY